MKNLRNSRAAALSAHLSRSWLLISANNENIFNKAISSEADSIVFDLEDGTPAAQKSEARERIVKLLSTGTQAWVRINAVESDWWEDDLRALSSTKGLRGVMLAMTEYAGHIQKTLRYLTPEQPILALIETASGLENATDIARTPGVFRLAFGVGDFRKDTGTSDDPLALAYARSKLVVSSRIGSLPPPIDGPTITDNKEKLLQACHVTTMMGMGGKLCLDPDQSDIINVSLSPSQEDIVWASQLLDNHTKKMTNIDGAYLPQLARAEKIVALAKKYKII